MARVAVHYESLDVTMVSESRQYAVCIAIFFIKWIDQFGWSPNYKRYHYRHHLQDSNTKTNIDANIDSNADTDTNDNRHHHDLHHDHRHHHHRHHHHHHHHHHHLHHQPSPIITVLCFSFCPVLWPGGSYWRYSRSLCGRFNLHSTGISWISRRSHTGRWKSATRKYSDYTRWVFQFAIEITNFELDFLALDHECDA